MSWLWHWKEKFRNKWGWWLLSMDVLSDCFLKQAFCYCRLPFLFLCFFVFTFLVLVVIFHFFFYLSFLLFSCVHCRTLRWKGLRFLQTQVCIACHIRCELIWMTLMNVSIPMSLFWICTMLRGPTIQFWCSDVRGAAHWCCRVGQARAPMGR